MLSKSIIALGRAWLLSENTVLSEMARQDINQRITWYAQKEEMRPSDLTVIYGLTVPYWADIISATVWAILPPSQEEDAPPFLLQEWVIPEKPTPLQLTESNAFLFNLAYKIDLWIDVILKARKENRDGDVTDLHAVAIEVNPKWKLDETVTPTEEEIKVVKKLKSSSPTSKA